MLSSVYNNGVAIYRGHDLEGKVGRLAMEIDMSEKLMTLGHVRFNGITLLEHIEKKGQAYESMKKQLNAMKGNKRG